jgi:hypothetical protein
MTRLHRTHYQAVGTATITTVACRLTVTLALLDTENNILANMTEYAMKCFYYYEPD